MAYTKTEWKDRIVQFPRRFSKSLETSDSVTLTPDPGTITELGTLFSAENMNHIEDGIFQAHKILDENTLRLGVNRAAYPISSTDLNTLAQTGIYVGKNLGGALTTGPWYILHMTYNFDGNAMQIAWDWNGTRMAFRQQVNGTWSKWRIIDMGHTSAGDAVSSFIVPDDYPTLQAAIDALPRFSSRAWYIYVRPEVNVDGNINVSNIAFPGQLIIQGYNGRMQLNGVLSVNQCVGRVSIRNVDMVGATSQIQVSNSSVFIGNITKTVAGNGPALLASSQGALTVQNSVIISNQYEAVRADQGGIISTGYQSLSGTGNTTVFVADNGIIEVYSGMPITGTTLKSELNGGRVFS